MKNLHFIREVLKRVPRIMLKRSKAIKLVSFNHMPDKDTNDTLIVRYAFDNALWYTFNGRATTCNRQVVIRHTDTEQIPLTVHGLFRKNNYVLTIFPDRAEIKAAD